MPRSLSGTKTCLPKSARNGVIERVVENWLTSANERQYQIPFCQLLAAEGETILYISAHGQMEQGKDVISRAKDRGIRAYQLKGGRLTLADWRKYQPEIHELVVYPIDHPSIGSRSLHKPFLVTNGGVADTVINAIRRILQNFWSWLSILARANSTKKTLRLSWNRFCP